MKTIRTALLFSVCAVVTSATDCFAVTDDEFETMKETIRSVQRQVDVLKAQQAPIGTVLALPAFADKSTILPNWKVCDGSPLERTSYSELYEVIGNLWGTPTPTAFSLPDLQGTFLRGISNSSGRDPDQASRTRRLNGVGTSTDSGTYQASATARPNSSFVTDDESAHTHLDPTYNNCAGPYELAGSSAGIPHWGADFGAQAAPTSAGTPHFHTVTRGGDAETRPINASVIWIIRVK